MGSKQQQDDKDSRKVEINTTDQSLSQDNYDPNLLINSFPDIVKFPRSPRVEKVKDNYDPNLNSDLAPVHENVRPVQKIDTQKLQDMAKF